MPLYEDRRNATNRISVDPAVSASLAIGPQAAADAIIAALRQRAGSAGRRIAASLDGWYGVDWAALAGLIADAAKRAGFALELVDATTLFKTPAEVAAYKARYTITGDPGFGWVNADGTVNDLQDAARVRALGGRLNALRSDKAQGAVLVIGCGANPPPLDPAFDWRGYADKTLQELLWQMWDGKLVGFGETAPRKDYGWKEYYYCDFYLLWRQKELLLPRMDLYVEAVSTANLKAVPRASYDAIMREAVRNPIKEIKIFQPGPWGAYRYKDLFDVPGLGCNAWNELAGPELSMLLDVGREAPLHLPTVNLLQFPIEFVGSAIHQELPGMFPMDVWLDDGYFPEAQPAERISMPIHNHPSSLYNKRKFNEPLGRYETYYICEAYEGANTWMGFKEDTDIEAWERACKESERTGKPIPNWKDFIANHKTVVGDLFLIPPGTTHGHGGNQMVLEMDTVPSQAGTEYSFFTYDFCRPSWDDTTKTMTGKPVKMHLDHGFDMDQARREDWVKKVLRAKPEVVKWTKDYTFDRYSSYGPMPFEIERFHFSTRADSDTDGRFMHILTLTVGERVIVRSKLDPKRCTDIELFQSVVIPAGFGPYEIINCFTGGGQNTVVQLRWKKG